MNLIVGILFFGIGCGILTIFFWLAGKLMRMLKLFVLDKDDKSFIAIAFEGLVGLGILGIAALLLVAAANIGGEILNAIK